MHILRDLPRTSQVTTGDGLLPAPGSGNTWNGAKPTTGGGSSGWARGGPLPTITYRRAWRAARERALTPTEVRSPLAATPYALRHACVSTWLNSGVSETLVARWAGHSVAVLKKVYAKCLVGEEERAKQQIEEALRDH